jgi:hypothetical protein
MPEAVAISLSTHFTTTKGKNKLAKTILNEILEKIRNNFDILFFNVF